MLNWHLKMQNHPKMRCKIYNFDVLPLFPSRILTNNPIIFAQFSSNLNSGMILLSSTIFTGHFRLHLEALWHNLVAILSRQHEMTVVIRQEAKFSFMPEILAADIVVGSCEGKKTVSWLGCLGDPEATCCCLFLLSLLCFPISWLLNILKHQKSFFLRLP